MAFGGRPFPQHPNIMNFRRRKKREEQAISTASLPDIVFMLLFFFMVTTVMQEVSPMVQTELPQATETDRLENRALAAYISVGNPLRKDLPVAPMIQIDDQFASKTDIIPYINARLDLLPESMRDQFITALKVDGKMTMGLVNDIKQELRKTEARRVMHNTETIEAP